MDCEQYEKALNNGEIVKCGNCGEDISIDDESIWKFGLLFCSDECVKDSFGE